MSHRNARLTPRGRQLLVERVQVQGMPVAHVARAMGISRQRADRWVRRFEEEGLAGLEDRSSRPRRLTSGHRPPPVGQVLRARREQRCGPAHLALECAVSERTVSRILRRSGVPRLSECDPMTGEVIRASRSTALRYVAGPSRRACPHRRQEAGAHSKGRRLALSRGSWSKTTAPKAAAPALVMTTSTPWSTITHASPIQQSQTTRPGRAAQDSSPGPQLRSGPSASRGSKRS